MPLSGRGVGPIFCPPVKPKAPMETSDRQSGIEPQKVSMTNVEHAFQRMARIGYKPRSHEVESESATGYAERFTTEQAAGFHIGSPVEETTIALVFAIEAARCIC